jgi:predicted metal-binding protein
MHKTDQKRQNMIDVQELEKRFRDHGFLDYKWLDPQKIKVAHWVRMKCRFGCPTYGSGLACPPYVPPVEECRKFFREYSEAAVFRFSHKAEKPEDRYSWTREINLRLLELEREVFLTGYEKTFLIFMDSCNVCGQCPKTDKVCLEPKMARPAPEGLAVDVYSTVRSVGYPIEVLSDYSQTMNRYAFLMID